VRWLGHAIECRVTAEDPDRDFAPTAGEIDTLLLPGGPGLRVDTHVFAGYRFPPLYDSLLAKLIAWGATREEALARMARALRGTRVGGVSTNVAYLQQVLADPTFEAGGVDVGFRPSGQRPAASGQQDAPSADGPTRAQAGRDGELAVAEALDVRYPPQSPIADG
jgi:acetyl/propionyl-CoA carboxylase alpha subunit